MDVIYFSLGTEWATEEPPLAPCAHCHPSPLERAETALWQQLAPFRLVEYAYIDNDLLPVERAFFGFPGGLICEADDDVPATWVAGLAAAAVQAPPPQPVFLYLKSGAPVTPLLACEYGRMLSGHVEQPLTGYCPTPGGGWTRWRFTPEGGGCEEGAATPGEQARLLSWADLCAANDGPETPGGERGRWARFRFGFDNRLLEFADAGRRDDFLGWSRAATDALFRSTSLSLPDLVQPANAVDLRRPGRATVPLPAPGDWSEGDAWNFTGDADGKVGAEAYWAHVRTVLARSCGARLPWSRGVRSAQARRRGEAEPR